jgi:pyrroline-5-carboxylate reductase
MAALAKGPGATDEQVDLAYGLFGYLGRVVLVEEALLNAVTALRGCGPAYAYVIIEALTDAGVSLGLPSRSPWSRLRKHFWERQNSCLEAAHTQPHLKDEVTTPAGCTIDGLLALEDGRLRATLASAVAVAARRSSCFNDASK